MAVLEFFQFPGMARGSGHIGQNRIYPGFLRSGSVFFRSGFCGSAGASPRRTSLSNGAAQAFEMSRLHDVVRTRTLHRNTRTPGLHNVVRTGTVLRYLYNVQR